MKPNPLPKYQEGRTGAAAVEFAVVLPILLVVVIGLIDICCMLMVQTVMSQAARDGARKCVVDGTTESDGKNVIKQQLKILGIQQARIDISPNPSQANLGNPIVVKVEVPFKEASWLRNASPFREVRLRSQAAMRSERIR